MKHLLTALALTLSTVAAHATSFTTTYSLNTFDIGQGSLVLPNANAITSGLVQVDQTNQELKLILERRFYCPPGAMCAMVMPAPLVITLPIIYVGSGFCGGKIINAEKNLLTVDGNRLQIEIVDENGNICDGPDSRTFVKPIQVTITETNSHNNNQVVSQMSGFPVAH